MQSAGSERRKLASVNAGAIGAQIAIALQGSATSITMAAIPADVKASKGEHCDT